jgi:hypothetical protein
MDQEKMNHKRRSLKRDMLIAFAVTGGVLLLLAVLVNLLEQRASSGNPSETGDYQYKFSDEYVTDIEEFLADEDYVMKDRTFYFYNADLGTTVGIPEGQYQDYGACVEFLCKMVEAIIAGDAKTYNTFFSELYFTKEDPQADFSMQKLYDIVIGTYSEEAVTKDGKTYTEFIYTLEYKIRRNNGSLRDDMGSNGTRTQYILITNREGKLLIDGIYTYQ